MAMREGHVHCHAIEAGRTHARHHRVDPMSPRRCVVDLIVAMATCVENEPAELCTAYETMSSGMLLLPGQAIALYQIDLDKSNFSLQPHQILQWGSVAIVGFGTTDGALGVVSLDKGMGEPTTRLFSAADDDFLREAALGVCQIGYEHLLMTGSTEGLADIIRRGVGGLDFNSSFVVDDILINCIDDGAPGSTDPWSVSSEEASFITGYCDSCGIDYDIDFDSWDGRLIQVPLLSDD